MTMVFISRDPVTKAINGVLANPASYAMEILDDGTPEVAAFLAPRVIDPIDSWDLVSLRIAFNHENRIRALEGKAAITVAQFKNALRALP